jgi:hypothetical protein
MICAAVAISLRFMRVTRTCFQVFLNFRTSCKAADLVGGYCLYKRDCTTRD